MSERELRLLTDKLNSENNLEPQEEVLDNLRRAQELLRFARASKPTPVVVRNYTTYSVYEEPL